MTSEVWLETKYEAGTGDYLAIVGKETIDKIAIAILLYWLEPAPH